MTRRIVEIAAAILVLHLILVQPNHPGAMTLGALRLVPLELPVILLALIAAPAAVALPLRVVLTGFLTLMPLVKVADYAAYVSFARGFNLVLDAHLLPAAWNLTSGAIGTLPAFGVVVGVVLATALLAAIVWWATGVIAGIEVPRPGRIAAGLALLPALAVAVSDVERWWRPFHPGSAAFTARLAVEHTRAVARTRTDLARFREEAARDAFAAVPADTLLAGLDGADVMVVFVESYGRSTLENPRYAPTIRPRLAAIEEVLDAAGLAMRSGWMTAPMVGGQSWLAHASVLSGLWIDNQRRYQALIASPRRTLMHYSADAGYRTVVVAPAITLAWPESGFFGYEAIYPAARLGYAGEPFNWVTMPDQFTLKAFERLELARQDRPPLMAEIALISSHAPWTPVPELVDWDAVGDGTVFNEMARAGDPPEVVWRDRDRVRDQFRQAVDYSLEVAGSFARRHADNPPLMIVLGDHEPATFVAEIDSFDVPVHVIGPPELVARIEHWGFTPGMTPAPDAPVWPMNAFRDRFLASFTPGAPPPGEPEEQDGTGAR
jgi:hypothetical protein